MQETMARANVVESHEKTNARYLRILHPALAHEIDCFPYSTPTELLHLAMKVERGARYRNQDFLHLGLHGPQL